MMIISHYGISVVINVILYDSQDELKTSACKNTCPEFYIIYHTRSVTGSCVACRTKMLAIMKYMNGGNTGVFKKVYAALHTHMKTAAQPVFI